MAGAGGGGVGGRREISSSNQLSKHTNQSVL